MSSVNDRSSSYSIDTLKSTGQCPSKAKDSRIECDRREQEVKEEEDIDSVANMNDELQFSYRGLFVDFPKSSSFERPRRDLLVINEHSSCPDLPTQRNNENGNKNTDNYGLFEPFPSSIPLRRKLRRRWFDHFKNPHKKSTQDCDKMLNKTIDKISRAVSHQKDCELYESFPTSTSSLCPNEEGDESTTDEIDTKKEQKEKENNQSTRNKTLKEARPLRRTKVFGRMMETVTQSQVHTMGQKKAIEVISTRQSFSGFRSCCKGASTILQNSVELDEDEMIKKFAKSIFVVELKK